ncbi:MAG: dihydrolipoyl dehydrogenase [Candidatus Heimdallarchaeota archaeon]|nr:MAG: dihydrolipoyl dehydrogenase [Candidatus Heimdallarchaeota archaeon]
MKNYDLIVIGTGSAMNLVSPILQQNPSMKVAVIDKDEPGGICLTRGCIPTKILLYPAELIRVIEHAKQLGISLEIDDVNFTEIMARMRSLIDEDIENIREGLSRSEDIDYYPTVAEFSAPYELKVGEEIITSKFIFLCTGSKPIIPPIKGLEKIGYHTSDNILHIKKLPKSLIIIGGGYIAAEYGHFFSAMGSKVTIIGRNPQFLPQEEPEVSELAKRELSKYMQIFTNHEAVESNLKDNLKEITSRNRDNGNLVKFTAEEVLIAAGRGSNNDILHPEKAGIETDEKGWIKVNEYLESSQPNVWVFGDANGKHLFKHVGNYESMVVFYNAVLKNKVKVDYHAIPSAVFTYPEIARVGLREKEAIVEYGEDNIIIGYQKYEDTAKGMAMDVKAYFVKVILDKERKILGAHIIGPQASVLIQEIITLMYTPERSSYPINRGMHIHPALSEVVERAFGRLMRPRDYHALLEEVTRHHH